MFTFELNGHPLLLGLPEEVDQEVLEDMALAISEDVLKGQPGLAKVSPHEVAQELVNAILDQMPDDVVDPAEWNDTSGLFFRLTQPVSRDVVLRAADVVGLQVHPPVGVKTRATKGFSALNVPEERIDTLIDATVNAVVFSEESEMLKRHRWGQHDFFAWGCLDEDGVHVIFALIDEWMERLGPLALIGDDERHLVADYHNSSDVEDND